MSWHRDAKVLADHAHACVRANDGRGMWRTRNYAVVQMGMSPIAESAVNAMERVAKQIRAVQLPAVPRAVEGIKS